MRKTLVIAAFAAALCSVTTVSAAPGQAADETASRATIDSAKQPPTDISAQRRYYRYGGRRWRAVRPYPYYGYYGPRPYYYRPYPYYAPIPFGFGFGYNPYYW